MVVSFFIIKFLFLLLLLLFSGFFLLSDILTYFDKLIKDDPDMSVAVAAIKTLLKFIEANKGIWIVINIFVCVCVLTHFFIIIIFFFFYLNQVNVIPSNKYICFCLLCMYHQMLLTATLHCK